MGGLPKKLNEIQIQTHKYIHKQNKTYNKVNHSTQRKLAQSLPLSHEGSGAGNALTVLRGGGKVYGWGQRRLGIKSIAPG